MAFNLTEFANQLPVADRRTKLAPFRDAILTMRQKCYTYRRILLILHDQAGLGISLSTIYWFVQTCLEEERAARRSGGKACPRPRSTPESLLDTSSGPLTDPVEKLKSNRAQDARNRPIFNYDTSDGLVLKPKL